MYAHLVLPEYKSWYEIGRILQNIKCPLEIFKKWSKKSIHYTKDSKGDIWVNNNTEQIYNIKDEIIVPRKGFPTLCKYAKEYSCQGSNSCKNG